MTLGKPNLILMIHLEAKRIVRGEERLPTKNEIRQQLEADGWNPKGKTAWSNAFVKAGLADLEQGIKDPRGKPRGSFICRLFLRDHPL